MQPDRKDNWKNRRRVIISCLIFVGLITVYLAIWGKDDELRRQIADGLLTTGMWLVLGYTGGAIVDDHLKRGGEIDGFFRNREDDRDRNRGSYRDGGGDNSSGNTSQQGDGNIQPE